MPKKYNITVHISGGHMILGQQTDEEVAKFVGWYTANTSPLYIKKCVWGDKSYTVYIVKDKVTGWHVE